MPHADGHNMGEFQRAVIRAAYRSPQQRRRRVAASTFLYAKHFLGGMLLIWPLSMIFFAALITTELMSTLLFILLALPGVFAWAYIFLSGARKDYDRLVRDQILDRGFMRRLH